MVSISATARVVPDEGVTPELILPSVKTPVKNKLPVPSSMIVAVPVTVTLAADLALKVKV